MREDFYAPLVCFNHFLQTVRGLLHSQSVRMFHVDEVMISIYYTTSIFHYDLVYL